MAHNREITAMQERVFRIARRDGLSITAIGLDSGLPYNTLRSYAGSGCATAEMPISALGKLAGVIPEKLLSLLLPEGYQIVRAPDHIDLDDLARLAREYCSEKDAAHHPKSEAGRDIGPSETERLTNAAAMLRAVAE